MINLTPVVKNIIILNIIFFILDILSPSSDFGYCIPGVHVIGGEMSVVKGYLSLWGVGTDCFKPFQLFTYMFLHGGFLHIFFNMLMLAFAGPPLEHYLGMKKFTILYTVTGLGAAGFHFLIGLYLPQAQFHTLVGASGAVYGVLTAFGIIFANQEMRLMIPPVAVKAKYLVFIFLIVGLIMGRNDNVADLAHFGGVLFGFFMVSAWRR